MVIKRHMVKLGDVCRVLSGTTPDTNNPVYWKGNLPWITPAEITESFDIIFDTKRAISKEAVEKKGLPLLPKGTVLLSSRAPIGKVAIAGIDMYCNQGFKNLVCSDKIYNKYLYFFLKSKTKFLNSLGRGATFKEISKSIVENILIPCPNIQIQKQIAERLDKVRELIAKQKEQIAKLDLLIKSRFLDMFGDPISNPKGLPQRNMQEISEEIFAGGDREQDLSKDLCGEYQYPVYSNGETNNGLLGYSKNYRVAKRAITVSARGTIGFLSIREPFFTPVVRLITIIPKKEVNIIYLKYMLRCLKLVSSGTSQGQLTVPDFKRIKIILISKNSQDKFSNFVKSVEQQKEVFSARLSHLEVLYKSLMQEYFG